MTDPYDTPEEHAEILTFRGKVLYDGPFSTYREIHIAIRGFYAGLRTGTFEDLPKVPVEWSDEGQYYEGMAAIAYDVKRGQQSAIVAAITVILAFCGLGRII
jgi:hypothetical protein